MDPKMLELLISELDISEREVFHLPGPLDLTGLFSWPILIEPNSNTLPSCPQPIPISPRWRRPSRPTCSPL